jgi:glycosyltransferase involved in cell wall biosynthesis
MAERLPSVSVVMPTFNRRHLLPQVVEPLLADLAATEVVVVVDGCEDGSYEWLAGRAAREARLRPVWIENGGQHGARRAGVEMATGEVVLLLDDDVLAEPGLVAGHASHHALAQGLVVVGYTPLRVSPNRRPGDFPTRVYAREYEQACRSYERRPDGILRGLYIGNASVRREDWVRVTAESDPQPLAYHEDRELGLRFLKARLRGIFDRSLRAQHLHSRSLEAFARDSRAQGEAMIRLHARHGDVLGRLPEDAFTRGLPGPLARWVRLCTHSRVAAPTAAGLRGLVRLAGAGRAFRVEELGGRLLRRVEQQRGAARA